MGTHLTTSFTDLLDPSFRKIMKAWGDKEAKFYDKCAVVEPISTNWVKESYVVGVPTMPTKTQGSAPSEYQLTQRLDKQYTAVSYGMKVTVAYEMQDDDVSNTRIIKKIPTGLAKAGRDRKETLVANLYNNADSDTGSDGVSLLNTAHPTSYYDGTTQQTSTQSNTPSSAVNLGETSLEDAIVALENTTDEAGLRMGLKARKLVVAPALRSTALKLLGSTLEAETANNAINTLKGRLELVVNPYITDTNAWCIIADENPLNCFIREPFNLKSFMAVDGSRNAVFAAYQRIVVGYTYWKGIYGSMGTS